MKRTAFFVALAVLLVAAVVAYLLWPHTPAVVADLRDLPHVSAVDVAGAGPLTVVHLRDWHVAPGADDEQVEAVQGAQLAIIRRLIRRHGVKVVYSEGLSKESLPDFRMRMDLLRDWTPHEDRLAPHERAVFRRTLREVGAAGQLLLEGEIDDVLPLEDEKALQAARPEGDVFDRDLVTVRQRAMVAHLPAEGLAVIVLGGSHDLGPLLPDAMYVRVTPKAYPR